MRRGLAILLLCASGPTLADTDMTTYSLLKEDRVFQTYVYGFTKGIVYGGGCKLDSLSQEYIEGVWRQALSTRREQSVELRIAMYVASRYPCERFAKTK